ncbi:hypothetical protein [Paraburkholderia sp. RL17-347-BIC-D]|uniref:hypothetical protein n=1 Tax=Paraburkholderia sp. RL17-347-BIC-D TaxID=3031632 RepID=UPI0038B76C84
MEHIEKKQHAVQDSLIPLGIIAPASEYRGADARLGGPVLEQMVEFDPGQYVNARRAAFDTFVMVGPLMPMIVFSPRLEDALLNWLADPTEPDVWKAIGTWNKHGVLASHQSFEFWLRSPSICRFDAMALRSAGVTFEPLSDNTLSARYHSVRRCGMQAAAIASAPSFEQQVARLCSAVSRRVACSASKSVKVSL